MRCTLMVRAETDELYVAIREPCESPCRDAVFSATRRPLRMVGHFESDWLQCGLLARPRRSDLCRRHRPGIASSATTRYGLCTFSRGHRSPHAICLGPTYRAL